jgi:hypothetical protein
VDVVLERSPYADLVPAFAVDLGSGELNEFKQLGGAHLSSTTPKRLLEVNDVLLQIGAPFVRISNGIVNVLKRHKNAIL